MIGEGETRADMIYRLVMEPLVPGVSPESCLRVCSLPTHPGLPKLPRYVLCGFGGDAARAEAERLAVQAAQVVAEQAAKAEDERLAMEATTAEAARLEAERIAKKNAAQLVAQAEANRLAAEAEGTVEAAS